MTNHIKRQIKIKSAKSSWPVIITRYTSIEINIRIFYVQVVKLRK